MKGRILNSGSQFPEIGDHIMVADYDDNLVVLAVRAYIGRVHGNWSLAEVDVTDLDPGEVKIFPVWLRIPCQCGCHREMADLGVEVEVIPEEQRDRPAISLFGLGERLRVTPECAEEILDAHGKWARVVL